MVTIYCTDGEWVGVYEGGNLFNVDGEWLGFVVGREVYDPGGSYLGFLSDDRRLLRTRSRPHDRPRLPPPPQPARPELPATMPLAPMFRSLPYGIIDMFEEHSVRLSSISETRPDME